MLITEPDDEREILRAEDEAIAATEHPTPQPEPPAGSDLARLIARLADGEPSPPDA